MTVFLLGFVPRERLKVWPVVVVVFVGKSTTAIVEGPSVEQALGEREAGVGVVDAKGSKDRMSTGLGDWTALFLENMRILGIYQSVLGSDERINIEIPGGFILEYQLQL